MRVGLILASLLAFLAVGCQSKEKCLEKYHFKSCEEFKQVYAKTRDKDEALKMHSISIECGCKTDTE